MRPGAAALALIAAACAAQPPPRQPEPYRPSWQDYARFAAAWPDLLEPNYLPFMLHRTPGQGVADDTLFFCRWDEDAMPLAVHVPPVEIPEGLQDEFDRRAPQVYLDAVRRAFATWESQLEGLVRFRLVDDEQRATLLLQLVAERAPAPGPELQVLGRTSLAGACRVDGLDADAERLGVDYGVRELSVFLADEHGLLTPDQVEWVVLHEIGHALGMRGHSPIRADLMFEVARDRIQVAEGLSAQDVNSFLSLYRLPNGAIFGSAALRDPEAVAGGPGRPQLAMAPHVDARHGFELHPPGGWIRVTTAHGMVAVHGTSWDYAASFQIVVQRYDTIEAYLERYGRWYLQRGRISRPLRLVVNGRRALQAEIERHDAPRVEQVTLIEVGDGRLLVVTADCTREQFDAYQPWFRATLASLEVRELPSDAWPRRRAR